ncbi:MAG: CDP-diacylglycerol--serine O-phosphatidyltransferase [Zoogloeaceae bacterium]|nr:CDP-diacylglycerol--serine O-phosphatidyltransferase [Zoogloeaceae bacterium]
MKVTSRPLSAPRGLSAVWRGLRKKIRPRQELDALPAIPVAAENFSALESPEAFRRALLTQIAAARKRVLIAALYLEDDDGGREILEALYAAKAARPELAAAVFVDWHRAQRGLIGKKRTAGNAALYRAMAERFGAGVEIYGVPAQRREFMGVMHLKGFVIDDTVFYSGASLNNVYLRRHDRYRLDRYHVIQSSALAESMSDLLNQALRQSPAVRPLNTANVPKTAELRPAIAQFRRAMARARYRFSGGSLRSGEVGVTPLLGLGARGNELNRAVVELIAQAKNHLVLFTPYFNLPGPARRALDKCLKGGCRVTIVLGDKTANDFYLPPDEPFRTIGVLPYLYESNLRRFCRARQKFMDAERLDVRLWQDGDNTYHVKGLLADDRYILLTGSNINPRAWRLDLENGLLIHDPQKLLAESCRAELERIFARTRRLESYEALETLEAYPAPVQRLLKRLARVRADRLINQVL